MDLGVGLNIALQGPTHKRHVIHSQGLDSFFDIVYNGVKIILVSDFYIEQLRNFMRNFIKFICCEKATRIEKIFHLFLTLVSTSCGRVVRDFEREAKTRCNFQFR